MALQTPHPLVQKRAAQWGKINDTIEGEDQIKARGDAYLPRQYYRNPTPEADKHFRDYVERATFPDYVKRTVGAITKLIYRRPPTISYEIDGWKEHAKNVDGCNTDFTQYGLEVVEQMVAPSRVGCLVDAGPGGGLPYATYYLAGDIIKWWWGMNEQTGVKEVRRILLRETAFVEDPRNPDEDIIEETRYRDLELNYAQPPTTFDSNGDVYQPELGESEREVYVTVQVWKQARDEKGNLLLDAHNQPKLTKDGPAHLLIRNSAVLDFIPFYFGNAEDTRPEPGLPVMLGVTNAALGMYRNSADLENGRHWSGHVQAYLFGVKRQPERKRAEDGTVTEVLPEITFGNGSIWMDENDKAHAGVIGASSNFQSLENGIEEKKKLIVEQGGRLVESAPTQMSATQSRLRDEQDKSTVSRISDTGQRLLHEVLTTLVWWREIGVTRKQVSDGIKLRMNSDQGLSMTARDAKAWAETNIINPKAVTDQEMFDLFKRSGVYDEDVTFEEHNKEVALILAERALAAQQKPGLENPRVSSDDKADEDFENDPLVTREDEDKGDEPRTRTR